MSFIEGERNLRLVDGGLDFKRIASRGDYSLL